MLFLSGHGVRTRALAYSPDGLTIATGGADGTVRLWDFIAGVERLRLEAARLPILGVAWSLDGSIILASDFQGTIRAWDVESGELFNTFHRSGSAGAVILGLIERPGDVENDPNRSRRTDSAGWRLSHARVRQLFGQSYLLNRDGIQEGEQTWLEPIFPMEARGERITVHLDDRNLYLLIPTTTNAVRAGCHLSGSGVGRNHSGDDLVAFTPDDRTMAFMFDGNIQLWEIGSCQVRFLGAHRKPVRALAFSPDGRTLASGGHDGMVCLWDVAGYGEPAKFSWGIGMIDAVAFSPDGSTVAVGGRTGIVVWDVGEDPWA